TDKIKQDAREQGLTLRQVALQAVSPRPNFIGTPEQVADELIRWFEAGASDGFILGFSVQREGLDDFVGLVLPILAARGYHRGTLEGATLRDHLGLPRKAS